VQDLTVVRQRVQGCFEALLQVDRESRQLGTQSVVMSPEGQLLASKRLAAHSAIATRQAVLALLHAMDAILERLNGSNGGN